MTRGYWLDYIEEDKTYPKRAIIMDIYDDFQTRICENCKHKYVVDAMTVECRNNDSMLEYLDLDCFPDFGCNRFEAKK